MSIWLDLMANNALEREAEELRRKKKEQQERKELARRNAILAEEIERLKNELGEGA